MEVDRLKYIYHTELALLDEGRLVIIQNKLIRKAQRLMLPVPKQNGTKLIEEGGDANWEVGLEDLILRPEALTKLRREVRRERKERFDLFFPWITLLIGLFGALAALGTVVLRFF